MKKSGQCPKCDSTEVWNNTHVSGGPISPRRWILVRGSNAPWKRKYAFKDEYVCIGCGYSEAYIDEKGLETIRELGYS